jgi:hypothetical protein
MARDSSRLQQRDLGGFIQDQGGGHPGLCRDHPAEGAVVVDVLLDFPPAVAQEPAIEAQDHRGVRLLGSVLHGQDGFEVPGLEVAYGVPV